MEIVSYCPRCNRPASFASAAAPDQIVCQGCGAWQEVRLTESISGKNIVDRCVLCGCGHLYVEKDFNSYVGLAVIVMAIAGSAIAWARNVLVAIGILAAAALGDLVFWIVSRERTRCYRCEAIYRGAATNPAHGRYDLGVAGRFADDYDEQRELHQK